MCSRSRNQRSKCEDLLGRKSLLGIVREVLNAKLSRQIIVSVLWLQTTPKLKSKILAELEGTLPGVTLPTLKVLVVGNAVIIIIVILGVRNAVAVVILVLRVRDTVII